MGAREQMYPQVMTAWKKHPEGRSASWENMGQVRCHWEDQLGEPGAGALPRGSPARRAAERIR